MLRFPNYYKRNTNQIDKKSQCIWQKGNPDCLPSVNRGESPEVMQAPCMFRGNGHWEQPQERTAPRPEEKNCERAKPRTLIPTSGPMLRKTTIHTDRCTSTRTAVVPEIAKTQTQEKVQRQIKSWKSVVHIYTICYHSDTKHRHWSYEITPLVTTRMDLGGAYTQWSQQQRKIIADDVPSRQN